MDGWMGRLGFMDGLGELGGWNIHVITITNSVRKNSSVLCPGLGPTLTLLGHWASYLTFSCSVVSSLNLDFPLTLGKMFYIDDWWLDGWLARWMDGWIRWMDRLGGWNIFVIMFTNSLRKKSSVLLYALDMYLQRKPSFFFLQIFLISSRSKRELWLRQNSFGHVG